jgi:hypothetical protein
MAVVFDRTKQLSMASEQGIELEQDDRMSCVIRLYFARDKKMCNNIL